MGREGKRAVSFSATLEEEKEEMVDVTAFPRSLPPLTSC